MQADRRFTSPVRVACSLVALMIALWFVIAPARTDGVKVDLALALAIDCSYSVNRSEHLLQMQGLAAALRSPEVREAINAGAQQKIAIAVFQWADESSQKVVVPWTMVSTADDLSRLAAVLAQGQRAVPRGGTAMSASLLFGQSLLQAAPPAQRRVIDVSTDGRNNMGLPLPEARARVLSAGITINGLAISNEWPTLPLYLEQRLIGGPESFVIEASTYADFETAMRRKLVREITGPGLT